MKSLPLNLVGVGTAAMIAAVLGVAVAAGGWTQRPSADDDQVRPVSEAEARTVLAGLVSMADNEDWVGLCSMHGAEGLGCDSVQNGEVLDAVRAARPLDAPTVVSARPFDGSDCFLPGFILELEGVDGRGVPYRSDLFVARDHDDQFLVSMPVYWFGARFFSAAGCSRGS